MSVSYYVTERKVPAGPDKGRVLQFGQVRAGSTTDFDVICHMVSLFSTATGGDARLVLRSLLDIISRYLQMGHVVKVGPLGNFRPVAGSSPALREEDVTAHLIRTPRIIFSPGKGLRKMLRDVSYRKFEPLVRRIEEECDEPHSV